MSIALDGLHVVFTRKTSSGNVTPYTFDVPLSGMMPAGHYIVIANQAAITNFSATWDGTIATGLVINQPDGWFFNTEPGAVGLFDANALRMVGAFGYKAAIPASTIMGYAGTLQFCREHQPVGDLAHRRELDQRRRQNGRGAHPHAQRSGHRGLLRRHQVHTDADPGRPNVPRHSAGHDALTFAFDQGVMRRCEVCRPLSY